jgi:hypothetical protein
VDFLRELGRAVGLIENTCSGDCAIPETHLVNHLTLLGLCVQGLEEELEENAAVTSMSCCGG